MSNSDNEVARNGAALGGIIAATAASAGAHTRLEIAPIARAEGVVALPGSKSISNRALLLAALAEGSTELTGLLEADDTARMIDALRVLGVRIDVVDDRCMVDGAAGAFP